MALTRGKLKSVYEIKRMITPPNLKTYKVQGQYTELDTNNAGFPAKIFILTKLFFTP